MHKLLPALLALMLLGCDAGTADETLVRGGYDEKEMDAAIARSRREVDKFIKELETPTGENHAVKAPITDQGKTEHFWLTDVKFKDGEFSGVINNDPGVVTNVKVGQAWKLKKDEISDWMYLRNGKIYGNYTMRPLLKTLPESQAKKFRAMLAEP